PHVGVLREIIPCYVYNNFRLAVDSSHFFRFMAAPPIIHPKSSRQKRQKTFPRSIQASSRLPYPANIEHPTRFFAHEKRRFDRVRNEVRPWVTSRSELNVVPRV